jgi:hypothetical protein
LEQRPLQLWRHQLSRALRNDSSVHDDHDQADDGTTGVYDPQHHGRAGIAQIKRQDRSGGGIGKSFGGLAHRIVLVGTHGAFAQPQHIAGLVMQGYGVGPVGFDRRAHFLANGIKINKRTIRLHQGCALLHKSATRSVCPYIYRTGGLPDVMSSPKRDSGASHGNRYYISSLNRRACGLHCAP